VKVQTGAIWQEQRGQTKRVFRRVADDTLSKMNSLLRLRQAGFRHKWTPPTPIHITVRHKTFENRFPKNAAIPHTVVQVLQEDGSLSHPHKLEHVLDSFNKDTHFAILVESNPPTVRITSKLEETMRKLGDKAEKKAVASKGKIVTKTVQLSWVTAGGDYDHKVEKLVEDLQKPAVRAEVVFTPKRRVRSPPKDEMNQRLNEVFDKVKEFSTEWKERDFSRGGATIYLQSTAKKDVHLPTRKEIQDLALEKLGRKVGKVGPNNDSNSQ